MPDIRDRLIETAVRPLADNAEMRFSATELLRNVTTESGTAGEVSVARWDAVDRKRGWRWIIPWMLMAVFSAVVIALEYQEVSRLSEWSGWMSRYNFLHPLPEAPMERVAASLGERDRLLLFGDLNQGDKVLRMEALWHSEPTNPAFYACHAVTHLLEKETLPPDYLETARRIDPENSWFLYLAAGSEMMKVVKKEQKPTKRVAGKVVREIKTYKILDPERYARTLQLLEEAGRLPKFQSYNTEMMRARMRLIPQRTFEEFLDSQLCMMSMGTGIIHLRKVPDVMAARMMQLADAGDVEGFKAFSKTSESLLDKMTEEEPGTLVDELVLAVVAGVTAEYQEYAFRKLGMEEEAVRWKNMSARLQARAENRNKRPFIVDGKAVPAGKQTGLFFGDSVEMVARHAEHQPPVTDAELEPGRLFEHEMASRFLAHALWVLLLPCAAVLFFHRFCVTRVSRGLALRMKDLLVKRDHSWIIGLGVVLPFLFVMMVNRLTPLGGREFGIKGVSLLMPLAHFVGLSILWLVVPVQVVRWRLSRQAGHFGFRIPRWWDWLAVAAAVAFIPLIGWAVVAGAIPDFWKEWVDELGVRKENTTVPLTLFWYALGCGGFALLWLAVTISQTLLGRAERQFQKSTVSLVLIPTLAWAMTVLALSILFFKTAGQHHYEQEKLMKLDRDGPGWSVFEYKVAMQSRKELREILSGPNE